MKNEILCFRLILKQGHDAMKRTVCLMPFAVLSPVCAAAAACARCPTPFAGSCPTRWCTSTWASAPTGPCPPTSSRSRPPASTPIPSTPSGSSLAMRTESSTWGWVLGALRPCLYTAPSLWQPQHPQVQQLFGASLPSVLGFQFLTNLLLSYLKTLNCDSSSQEYFAILGQQYQIHTK